MNADQRRLKQILFLSAFICVHLRFIPSSVSAQTAPSFNKRWLTAQFYSEGANYADFNNDGKMDVVAGPFIYDGPDFTIKHAFKPVQAFDPLVYSDAFFEFTGDFNNDGWQDVMTVGFPGAEANWYENPKGATGEWKKHLILDTVDDESPVLTKLVGDKPVLVCIHQGKFGYAAPDPSDVTKPWIFHGISPKKDAYQRFTHGLGVGDVNGDGRLDLLEASGWWEQPESTEGDPVWKKHDFKFADTSAEMYAFDVDGDGDADIVTCTHAHGFGIAWYEQVKKDGKIDFIAHPITSDKAEEKINGVQFSEPHSMAIADMDGDGLPDLVTGKRYWAHGPQGPDPDSEGRAVLYWFKLIRDGDGKTSGAAHFEPHLIDDNSGVGTMVVAADVNGDKKPDVIIGNKKGSILFLSK